MTNSKKAFTLIELIFVIVVLGIVLSIVAEIIAKMYGGYITARTSERLQSKTELATQQIANRLSYRIPPTVIAIDTDTVPNTMIPLTDANISFDVLEWIGRDFVSFRGDWNNTRGLHEPMWSGFIDLENPDTNQTQFATPATKPLTLANSIATQSFGDVNLTGAFDRPAIVFKGRVDDFDFFRYYSNPDANASSHYVYPVQCVAAGCSDSNPVLEFVNNYSDTNDTTHDITLYEQYDFAWSAYAIVPVGSELRLYYGYQPWMGENYLNGTFSVLVDDLQTFRFTQVGEVIRVKLCATENDGGGFANDDGNLTVCKEKAIL